MAVPKKFRFFFFSELKHYFFWRCIISELLASTLYCFLAGTLVFNLQERSNKDLYDVYFLGTALMIGCVVGSISSAFGVTNCASIFPAVTIGKCLTRHYSFLKLLFQFIVQMIGGIAGVALEHVVNKRERFVVDYPADLKVSISIACIHEGMYAFLLVLVFLKTCSQQDNRRNLSAHTGNYGLSGVCMSAIFFIGNKYTGSVLNTSLVFGIGIVYNQWPSFIWVYWVGPLTGGLLAGIVNTFFLFPPSSKELIKWNKRTSSRLQKVHKKQQYDNDNTNKREVSKYLSESCASQAYNNPVFDELSTCDTQRSDEPCRNSSLA